MLCRCFQGFYGEVYLCKLILGGADTPPIKCAVKRLLHKAANDEAYEKDMQEFERELKLMVPLEHPNIVKMYGECFYTYRGDSHFPAYFLAVYISIITLYYVVSGRDRARAMCIIWCYYWFDYLLHLDCMSISLCNCLCLHVYRGLQMCLPLPVVIVVCSACRYSGPDVKTKCLRVRTSVCVVDGQVSRLIVMEYIRCGSLSVFVRNKGKRIPLDERLQLYKKFSLNIAEVCACTSIIYNHICIIYNRVTSTCPVAFNRDPLVVVSSFCLFPSRRQLPMASNIHSSFKTTIKELAILQHL